MHNSNSIATFEPPLAELIASTQNFCFVKADDYSFRIKLSSEHEWAHTVSWYSWQSLRVASVGVAQEDQQSYLIYS